VPTPTEELGQVATVVRGVTFDKGEASDTPDADRTPILRAGNIAEELHTESDLVWVPSARVKTDQLLRNGDIAICMSSGSQSVVGKSAQLGVDWNGSVGAFCAIVRPRPDRVDPKYLSLYMRSEGFRAWTRKSEGANIKNIRHSELLLHRLPVPKLDEQRRIVDLLSRAENIVRMRREAEAKAREIIPALFIDMFGDPGGKEGRWSIASIGDLFLVKGGKRLPKGELYSPVRTPFRYIRGADIWPNIIDQSDLRHLTPEIQSTIRRYTVAAEDVVLTIAGKIGVAAPVPAELSGANLTENAALLRHSGPRATLASYLSHEINSESVQRQIEGLTGRVTIGKLALERIRTIQIRVPPLELQERFEVHVRAASSLLLGLERACAASVATFQSLLAGVFQQ
jgi:type I restriction enzyme, S subunit